MSMQLRYDEDFIEAAVFLCSRGQRKGVPRLQVMRFDRQREKLYGILDPDDRNSAFFKLHLDWFREWGLEQPFTDILVEFPLLYQNLNILAVRKTPNRNDEGAELYVNGSGERTGLLALRLERLKDDSAFRDYLRHELTHLHDMLNPAFGYSPHLDLSALNAAQMRIARERYRLLWDITIDGRLSAAGHTPMSTREQYAAPFARAYSMWPEQKQAQTFEHLWCTKTPTHAELLALLDDPRGLRGFHKPGPGAACPLCDFPTFVWADTANIASEIVEHIMADFPAWSADQGLCNRCWEAYQVSARTELLLSQQTRS